jgi:hypothetical protein
LYFKEHLPHRSHPAWHSAFCAAVWFWNFGWTQNSLHVATPSNRLQGCGTPSAPTTGAHGASAQFIDGVGPEGMPTDPDDKLGIVPSLFKHMPL